MRSMPLAAALLLVCVSGCTGESACERFERIGAAGDARNQSASADEVREAAEALAECMAEEGERG
jgi:outer membrane lipoprotein-sorting protein